ncbi:glycosyltransferase family 2 protein [Luteirhabdus pelagi]|uniref:glycosyltransferase family 2 protein n=1 Tax=Luteirhabdus pelagi TaxID=2792783 RepID=UPI00193A7F18|nr:glycosyltransferase family A protein [Luteirhabdus pelagi]
MKCYIVIPAHNEEAFLASTLQSLVDQTHQPSKIVVVNDNSTDSTQAIIDRFASKYAFLSGIESISSTDHAPGSKVINAFQKGLSALDSEYDIICKFDADLIFPPNYLEQIVQCFTEKPKCGMAGGFCYVEKNGQWILESLTNKDHIRGALKAYRKKCFEQIEGLKNAMGWDTVDELLARYHGWEICTDESLQVKHLKPTGTTYSPAARWKQGEAFYKMRYGFWLTFIASAKLAAAKKSFSYFMNCMKGYRKAKNSKNAFLVSVEEGKFIRKLRWNGIRRKLF